MVAGVRENLFLHAHTIHEPMWVRTRTLLHVCALRKCVGTERNAKPDFAILFSEGGETPVLQLCALQFFYYIPLGR